MIRAMVAMGALTSLAAAALSAPPSPLETCRSIADPAARLACYDRAAGQTPAPVAPADTAVPAPSTAEPAPRAPTFSQHQPSRPSTGRNERREAQSDVDSRIAAVSPVRHGYYRLELADGTAYETTVTGAPPPVGAEVHIRRTFLGTTFFDIPGRSPVSVRPAREQ